MTWLEHNLAEYKKEHQTLGNEICHFFGISLILFSLFILGNLHAAFFTVTVGLSLGFLVLIGGWRGMSAVCFCFVLLVIFESLFIFTWKIAMVVFVVGWAFQFAGHFVFEKNKPAFLKAPISLLIAIFWLGEIIIFYPLWKKFLPSQGTN